MSIFESSPTYGGLLLKLAADVGLAKQRTDIAGGIGLPDDGLKLTTLKNALDASFEDVRSRRTWSWLYLRIEVELDPTGEADDCVNASATAYWLPLAVAMAPIGNVYSFAPASSNQNARRLPILGETALVERMVAVGTTTGEPCGVAFGYDSLDTDGDRVRRRMFVRVYPRPDQAYTIAFLAKARLETLAEFTERPDWPTEMDRCILWGAIAHMAKLGQTQAKIDPMVAHGQFEKLLNQAMIEDAQIDLGIVGSLKRMESVATNRLITFDSDGVTRL